MISVYERVLADRSSLMRRLPELCIHVTLRAMGCRVGLVSVGILVNELFQKNIAGT